MLNLCISKSKTKLSNVEVLNISINGIWLLVNDNEYFLTYKEFPWFKNATVAQIHNVQLHNNYLLSWTDLDIDIDFDSVKFPKTYPLKYL